MRYDITTRTLHLGKRDCTRCWGKGTIPERADCPKCGGTGNGPRGGARGCRACSGTGHTYRHDHPVTCPACDGHPTDHDDEGWDSGRVPTEVWDGMPLYLFVQDREASWNEQHLGFGCLWSVVDYGDHRKDIAAGRSQEFLARIRADLVDGRVQACKIVRDGDTRLEPVPMSRCETCDDLAPTGQPCPRTGERKHIPGPHTMSPVVIGGKHWTFAYPAPSAQVCDCLLVVSSRGGYSIRAAFTDSIGAVLDHAAAELGTDAAHRIGGAVYRAGGNGTLFAATYPQQ